jgi:hypothetical protein
MRAQHWIALVMIALLMPIAAQAQETQKVTGRVVDGAGKPVADADVASFWGADTGQMEPFTGVKTDCEGKFSLSMQFYGMPQSVLAFDKHRKQGGLTILEGKTAPRALEIKLGPVVKVHGDLMCKELGARPEWTNVYVSALPSRKGSEFLNRLFTPRGARALQCSSDKAAFSFLLPPGRYQFWAYGTGIQDIHRDLELTADKPDVDLKTLDVPATVIARHRGKEPPAWNVTDARGVKKGVKLSDFKGKWVLVEFWGFW